MNKTLSNIKNSKTFELLSNNKLIVSILLVSTTIFSVSLGFYVSSNKKVDFTLTVWPEYITNQQYDHFQSESGLVIKEVYFESNENLLSKMNTTSFDMLMPTDYIVEGLIQNKSVEKLSIELIEGFWNEYYDEVGGTNINGIPSEDIVYEEFNSNFTNLWQAVSSVYPMGDGVLSDYVVPYQTSDIKIVYNLTDPVVQKMFSERPELIGSYQSFLWIANEGGSILANKNMRDFMSLGLKATGNSINDYSEQALSEAYDYLSQIMPSTMLQHDDLARTAAHLDMWSVGYAFPGDFVMGIEDEWLDENADIPWYEAMLFTEPKEGSVVYFDIMAQGYGSSKDEYTSDFITFLSRPDVQSGSGYDSAESAGLSKDNPFDSSVVSDSKYQDIYNEADKRFNDYYGGVDYIYYAPSNKSVYEGSAVDVSGSNSYEYFCNLNGPTWEDEDGMPNVNSESELDAYASGMSVANPMYSNNWEGDYSPENNGCYDPNWEENVYSTYSGFSKDIIDTWFASPNYVNLYYQALIIHTDLDDDIDGDGIYDVQEIGVDSALTAKYNKSYMLPNGEVVNVVVNSPEDMLFNRKYGDEMYRYSQEANNAMSKVYNDLLALQNKM